MENTVKSDRVEGREKEIIKMNRPEELIKKIYEEQGQIKDVFFTACGGSLVDLYPGFYFINAE